MKWWRLDSRRILRHCERSEAIHVSARGWMDCFAPLAMTRLAMISDRLFVYGTLMRGYVHPMARMLSANAEYLGEASCRGRLYMVKHYPGLVLSDAPGEIVHGELYRLREAEPLLREFDMYEACGEGFPEPTQYVRQMLPLTLADGAAA